MSRIFWANCSELRRKSRRCRPGTTRLAPFFAFKRKFIQKRAISGVTKEQAEAIDGPGLGARTGRRFLASRSLSAAFSAHVSGWLDERGRAPDAIQTAARYAAWAALSHAGRTSTAAMCCSRWRTSWISCIWCPVESLAENGIAKLRLPERDWRDREGFQSDRSRHGARRRARSGHITASSATTRAKTAAPPA